MIARRFETEDERDLSFDLENLFMNLNVAYMVYDSGVPVQSGASQYDLWRVPMSVDAACTSVVALASLLLTTSSLI